MRRRARWWRDICSVRPTHCAAILVYCSVRDWIRFLRHRIRKYRIHPPTRYRIRCGFIFFHSGERIYSIFFWIRCRNHRMRVDGSRIRKKKRCGFENIRIHVDGALEYMLKSTTRRTRTTRKGRETMVYESYSW